MTPVWICEFINNLYTPLSVRNNVSGLPQEDEYVLRTVFSSSSNDT